MDDDICQECLCGSCPAEECECLDRNYCPECECGDPDEYDGEPTFPLDVEYEDG